MKICLAGESNFGLQRERREHWPLYQGGFILVTLPLIKTLVTIKMSNSTEFHSPYKIHILEFMLTFHLIGSISINHGHRRSGSWIWLLLICFTVFCIFQSIVYFSYVKGGLGDWQRAKYLHFFTTVLNLVLGWVLQLLLQVDAWSRTNLRSQPTNLSPKIRSLSLFSYESMDSFVICLQFLV